MRLLVQWILIATSVILLGFASEILTRRYVIWPEAKHLSDQLDRKELEQVFLGFDVLRSQLLTFTRTNGYWDQAYDYLRKPDEAFLEANFPLASFEQNSLHLVMFVSADNRFQKVLMTAADQEGFLDQPVLGFEDFKSILPDPLKAQSNAPLETSGFIKTIAGPMVFSAVTVMQADLDSESAGVMLIARFLDREAVDEVSETVKKNFELSSVVASQSMQPLIDAKRNADNKIFADLPDVEGKPLMRVVMALAPDTLNPWWSPASSVSLSVFVLGSIVAMALVYRSLVVPIGSLTTYLRKVRETGDFSARLKIYSRNELGFLAQECNNLLANIDDQHQRLEEQAEVLRKLSLHDGLTQLSNRRHLDEVLETALAHAQRQKMPLTLIMCDVDHFKLFNDTYGHQGGDKVLQSLAEILLLSRHRKTDLVARYGGEEFVVLLPDTDEAGAHHVIATIQSLLLKANISHDASPSSQRLTISMGAACMYAPFDLTAQELLRRADQALYQAKKLGRNRAEFWVGGQLAAQQKVSA